MRLKESVKVEFKKSTAKLKQVKFLKRIGSPKGGYWEVLKDE